MELWDIMPKWLTEPNWDQMMSLLAFQMILNCLPQSQAQSVDVSCPKYTHPYFLPFHVFPFFMSYFKVRDSNLIKLVQLDVNFYLHSWFTVVLISSADCECEYLVRLTLNPVRRVGSGRASDTLKMSQGRKKRGRVDKGSWMLCSNTMAPTAKMKDGYGLRFCPVSQKYSCYVNQRMDYACLPVILLPFSATSTRVHTPYNSPCWPQGSQETCHPK